MLITNFLISGLILLAIGLAGGLILSYLVRYFFYNRIDNFTKNKIIFTIIYFANFFLLYHNRPQAILPDSQVSPRTYLWVWATAAVILTLAPEMQRTLKVKGLKKDKDFNIKEKNLATFIIRMLASLGLMLAFILIVQADLTWLAAKLN